jgi:hypothetical protein
MLVDVQHRPFGEYIGFFRPLAPNDYRDRDGFLHACRSPDSRTPIYPFAIASAQAKLPIPFPAQQRGYIMETKMPYDLEKNSL